MPPGAQRNIERHGPSGRGGAGKRRTFRRPRAFAEKGSFVSQRAARHVTRASKAAASFPTLVAVPDGGLTDAAAGPLPGHRQGTEGKALADVFAGVVRP